MLHNFWNISLLLFILVSNGWAQQFTASVDKTKVPLNQHFTLSYKIDGAGNSFSPPNLSAFQVLSGPNQSSSMTMVNGKVSQSITLSYKLKSRTNKLGKVSIGPASIQSASKQLKSNAVTIEFVKASQQNTAEQNDISAQLDKNIHLVLSVSKSELFVGEQMVASYKLYFNTDINGITDHVKNPSFNSFWTQDFELKENDVKQVNYKGQAYYMVELKKVLLTPQKAGELKIESMGIELQARVRSARRNFSFFGSFRNVRHKVYSRSKKINVKPLPSKNKPVNFNGAVGAFSLESSLSKTEAEANEAISLKITVKGKGNLKLFDTPQLNIPPDIETYEPKITEKITASSSGNTGSKVFEYVLIPRYAGEYKIPSIRFSYFDLDKKSYIPLSSPDYLLKISGEAKRQDAGQQQIGYSNKDDVTLLGEDVLFIKTSSSTFKVIDQYYFKSVLFYSLVLVPLLGLIIALFLMRKYSSMHQDLALMNRRKASMRSKKRLSVAKLHLDKQETAAFYEALSKAIWSYFSEKMNIPYSEISRDKIEDLLIEKEIKLSLRQTLSSILEQCEIARFAAVSSQSDLSEIYENTANLLTKIDAKI